MNDEERRMRKEMFASELLEFIDNHDELSNIHKVDAMTAVMGCLLARMRPNVMKSIMPQVLNDVKRYANECAKVEV